MAGSSNQQDGNEAAGWQPRDEEAVRLLDYWRVLVRRKLVLLSCLAIIVAVIMIGTFLSVPVYQASTSVEIEMRAPDILTFKDVLSVDSSFVGMKNFYPTQYKILQSDAVIEIAAERLDLVNRPEFVNRKASPISRLFSWVGSAAGDDDEALPPDPLEGAVGFIKGGLAIRPVRNSQLVNVSFTDRDPRLAAEIADAVADAFIQFRTDARYDMTGKAKEFLAKDVARVQAEISQLQRQLQEYGVANEILGLSDGTRDISEQALADIDKRYTDAKSRLAVSEAHHLSLLEAPSAAMPEVLQSASITQLRQKHGELERRYRQMSERFNQNWPALIQVRGEMETAGEQLTREEETLAEQVRAVANANYEQAKAEVANLQAQREEQKKEVRRVNLDAIEYASLQSEIETKRTVLSDLASRQSQTETSYRLKETSTSNIRIVDFAKAPKSPIKPRKVLNLMIALFLGSVFGAGMAFLIDHLDNTIKTEQDIQRIGGLAVLGHIPLTGSMRLVEKSPGQSKRLASKLDMASFLDPKSTFSEAFRNLRTSLLLAAPDRPPRNVAITSPEPGDGKSTVALNLAIVLTQLGRRVLLIDADLRRPYLHKALGMSPEAGLSSFLSGNAELDDLIVSTEVPGLSIITSGPIPPNPSELLGSPGLDAIMTRYQQENRFDHILFDSPPVLSVTDATILASRMDATILVVRSGLTSREVLAQSVAGMQQSHVSLSGAVLNAVSEQAGYYYGRYRRYGGRYGYRYASHEEERDGKAKVG